MRNLPGAYGKLCIAVAEMTLPWLSIAPLGSPVVPLV